LRRCASASPSRTRGVKGGRAFPADTMSTEEVPEVLEDTVRLGWLLAGCVAALLTASGVSMAMFLP